MDLQDSMTHNDRYASTKNIFHAQDNQRIAEHDTTHGMKEASISS